MAATLSLNPTGPIGQLQKVPAVTVTGAGYVPIATLINPKRGAGKVTITGIVGAGAALTGLYLSSAAAPGGSHATHFQDADFNTPTTTRLIECTNNAYTTAANGIFQMVLELDGLGEINIGAKSGGTTTLALEVGY
jgi:hypothetical protein